jgi:hypothetical protein
MEQRTPRSSPLTRLGRALERAASVLFAGSDARARASGWEVRTAGRWNTSRVYHDPRYDRLRRPRPDPDRLDPMSAWVDPPQGSVQPDRARVAWSPR